MYKLHKERMEKYWEILTFDEKKKFVPFYFRPNYVPTFKTGRKIKIWF